MLLHGPGGLVADVFISDLYDLGFFDPGHQRHIRRPVPVLPRSIVRLDLRRLWVVLTDLLCREIYAVRVIIMAGIAGLEPARAGSQSLNAADLLRKSA